MSHMQVLAPKMKAENTERLFEMAVRQSVEELEESLAEEFPRPDAPDKLDPLGDDRLSLRYEGDRQCRPVLTPGQEKSGVTQEDLELQVWEHDGGCCAFRRKDGALCGETRFLEFDHIVSWALGGRSDSASNIQLLCRAHNQWKARQEFGRPYLRKTGET